MRFAYIDSNGNEVPIPSVDALALRIELGAISENTELYDAQADQWGPAHTHEIFRTLSRVAGDDEGFVAPPPVVPPPAMDESDRESESVVEDESVAGADELPATADDLGLTLAQLSAEEEDDEPEGDAAPGVAELDVDLATPSEPIEADGGSTLLDMSAPAPAEAPGGGVEDEGSADGFDFGDLAGGLELESTSETSGEPPPADPMESSDGDFSDGELASDFGGGDPTPDFSGGMELETPMEFEAAGLDVGADGSLELETPMSEFSPDAPPAWMEPDGPDTDVGDVMDFSSVGSESAGDGASDDVPLRERRTPRNKPSPPKHRGQRSLAGPIVGVVSLLALGVGAYVGWPLLSARLGGSADPEVPPVFIPDIPEELMPEMRSVAQAAFAATFEDVRRRWAASSPVTAPSSDWLSGVYLANASQFGNVEAFWDGMTELLDGVRAIDLATFDSAYRAELRSRAVESTDAAVMRESADSSFVAAEPARSETYGLVETLIDAALKLHIFLAANEANIEYVPASTITTDPVLEANPATPELRSAMEGMLDEVTGALAALNHLELVTAESLWGTLLARVQESGLW
jgi:hypothetical protein